MGVLRTPTPATATATASDGYALNRRAPKKTNRLNNF